MATATSLDVELPYVKRNEDGVMPDHAEMFSYNAEYLDTQPVKVCDVRETDREFTIPKSGFQYGKFTAPPDIDYRDDKQVVEKYFPVLEQFLKEQLGASAVKAFHHKVRNATYEPGMAYTRFHSCPARRPHVDVSSSFAPILFGWDCPELYKDAVENNKHWQMVNVWRPLKTIRKSPVVVAETSSVDWEDYLIVPQPEVGPGVSGYWLQRPVGSGHSWWYMSEQTPEDVLLFLQHDSKGSQVVPHTSVTLPGPDPVPDEARESVEVRLVVIYWFQV